MGYSTWVAPVFTAVLPPSLALTGRRSANELFRATAAEPTGPGGSSGGWLTQGQDNI
jgi:hypothetical protein